MSDQESLVRLSPEIYEVLSRIAKKRQLTIADILKEAIAYEQVLSDAQQQGHKILIEDDNKRYRQVVIR